MQRNRENAPDVNRQLDVCMWVAEYLRLPLVCLRLCMYSRQVEHNKGTRLLLMSALTMAGDQFHHVHVGIDFLCLLVSYIEVHSAVAKTGSISLVYLFVAPNICFFVWNLDEFRQLDTIR